jgi:hypothetical protein
LEVFIKLIKGFYKELATKHAFEPIGFGKNTKQEGWLYYESKSFS